MAYRGEKLHLCKMWTLQLLEVNPSVYNSLCNFTSQCCCEAVGRLFAIYISSVAKY